MINLDSANLRRKSRLVSTYCRSIPLRNALAVFVVVVTASFLVAVSGYLAAALGMEPRKRDRARTTWTLGLETAPVPATQKHVQSATILPDGKAEDPKADNFTQVKYMVRGYCYAASQLRDQEAPGGFGGSRNTARRVKFDSKRKTLFLLAQPGVVADFGDQKGMRVMLVNSTQDTLEFEASDSRLDIYQEAQDGTGAWRPIEYLPQSWCGNSYHRVFLEPGYHWEFAAPRYQGALSTKLRFTMQLSDGSLLHSNEFNGSVNPEQFSAKQGYQPASIMDPYVD